MLSTVAHPDNIVGPKGKESFNLLLAGLLDILKQFELFENLVFRTTA